MNAHLLGQQRPQEFGCSVHDGPLAAPVIIPALMQSPNGAQVIMSFGGLTKLEHAAIAIAAGHDIGGIEAVQRAKEVLAECRKAQPELYPPPQ